MSQSKSIPDITAQTPTVDAARRALSLRLEALRERFGAALRSVGDDLEEIHQLRVACRRATAAVDLFQSCLPKRVVRRARKNLKGYRRAAGDARDWDVWLLALGARLRTAAPEHVPAIDLLLGYCLARRISAQEQLESARPAYPFQFERWMSEVVAAVQSPAEPEAAVVGDLGRIRLLPQFELFWQHVQQADKSWDELHETRIHAKRLRYGMELLTTALPSGLRETVSKQLAKVQAMLGDANDGFVGLQRLELLQRRIPELYPTAWPRWAPLVQTMAREHQTTMDRAREDFLEWRASAERERLDVMFRSLLAGGGAGPTGDRNLTEPVFPVSQAS